jgi:BASS family bile acid:Na+ symporter
MKNVLIKMCGFITRYMALIVLICAVAALFFDKPVAAVVKTSYVSFLLGLVMFGMGMTLKAEDFRVLVKRPWDMLVGCLAQFIVMPSLAWVLTKVFSLPDDLALGVVLVGCCPGGTASNVITYLAKGDLALSVGMTGVSTLLAPLLTPLLVLWLAGEYVDVSLLDMFLSIVQVIILPVVAGVFIRRQFPRFTSRLTDYLPAFSSVVIAIIVMAVVSANAGRVISTGLVVLTVVVLHNLFGFIIGFLVAKMLRLDRRKATAISVEVGMQNSGLACSLAAQHFQQLAMATVPGAIFSVWHNISGALMAKIFAYFNSKEE